MPHRVGIIGAGPGAEALHLPTLDRMPDRFRVVHLADAGSGRAAEIASLRGIRSSPDAAGLLADPEVDVVAVCSPPARHAEHVLAAVAAGARGVLVEKPLALSAADAERIAEVCRTAGVALVVGTNHLHDPAWGRAKHHLLARGGRVQAITASVALAPNHPLHAAVTEMVPRGGAAGRPAVDLADPAVAAGVVGQLVTGLLVHDLPLVRDLAPDLEQVVFARLLPPVGCAVGFRASGVLVQLSAVLVPDGGDPDWRVTVETDAERIDLVFPPSFVHAGAAEVAVTDADARRTVYPRDDDDGYLAEWRALADLLDGAREPEWGELVDDARYVAAVAAGAVELVARGTGTAEPAAPPRSDDAPAAAEAEWRDRPADAVPFEGLGQDAAEPQAADGIGRPADPPAARGVGMMAPSPGLGGPRPLLALDEGFRVAAAGLPRSIRSVDDPSGAIVAGRDDPAAAVVVLRAADVAAQRAERPPLVVARSFLRADVAADALAARAGAAPRIVVAECAATDADDPAIVDAIGWLRVLAGGPLRLVAHARRPRAVLAAFTAGAVTATLTAAVGAPHPRLRIRALGETTTEVEVDAAGRASVATSTAAGRLVAPQRWESSDREALRRALAVEAGASANDVQHLVHDRALARAIIHDVHAQDRRDDAPRPGPIPTPADRPGEGDDAVAPTRGGTTMTDAGAL